MLRAFCVAIVSARSSWRKRRSTASAPSPSQRCASAVSGPATRSITNGTYRRDRDRDHRARRTTAARRFRRTPTSSTSCRCTAIPGLDRRAHAHDVFLGRRARDAAARSSRAREPAETVELAARTRARRSRPASRRCAISARAAARISPMRDLIDAGTMIGPRMFVAGQGISAGRGGGRRIRRRCSRPIEARLATPADWVKVYASRGSYQSVDTTQTITSTSSRPSSTPRTRRAGKVAIHSYGASGVKDAVRAGADSIEHGIELDDETLAEMAKQGTVWVPTDRSQPLLRGREGRIRFRAGDDPAASGIHRQEPRIDPSRVQGRRAARAWDRTRCIRCSARTRASSAGS